MTAAERLTSLLDAVSGGDCLLILPHNDPDPDALASALALRFLLTEKAATLETLLAYHGLIGRAENKALVDYFDQPFQPLTNLDLTSLPPVALVDTQPGAGNHACPPGCAISLVIDHHPHRESAAPAGFVDIRPEVGSTSALLTEYLCAAGLEPDQALATALFYGIKTDTMGLTRSVSPVDTAAYLYLQPKINTDVLLEIERAQVPLAYFKSIDTTLRAARMYDHLVITSLGPMAYPDLAAEMADMLLRLEGSEWVICMGVYNGQLILSIRTRNRSGGAGQLAQSIVGNQGTAGGHGLMAGGHIPLRGRDAKRLTARITRVARERLNISPAVIGRRLV